MAVDDIAIALPSTSAPPQPSSHGVVVNEKISRSAFFLYILSAPMFLSTHLGLEPTQYSWLFIPSIAGILVGSQLSGRDPYHRVVNFEADPVKAAHLMMAHMDKKRAALKLKPLMYATSFYESGGPAQHARATGPAGT